MSRWIPRALAGAVLAASAAFLLAACDEGSASNGDALQVASAVNLLDSAGLHGIDDSINKDQKVPATAKTAAQKAATVTRLTSWPTKNLRDTAEDLADTLEELATVLDAEQPDLKKAGELAKKAHDLEHDLSHDTWAHLYEEAGIAKEDDDHHQE
ncbi:MAG: hypothetical protein ACKVVT_09225 [Dehalococcoidia bacterium]